MKKKWICKNSLLFLCLIFPVIFYSCAINRVNRVLENKIADSANCSYRVEAIIRLEVQSGKAGFYQFDLADLQFVGEDVTYFSNQRKLAKITFFINGYGQMRLLTERLLSAPNIENLNVTQN